MLSLTAVLGVLVYGAVSAGTKHLYLISLVFVVMSAATAALMWATQRQMVHGLRDSAAMLVAGGTLILVMVVLAMLAGLAR